MDALAITFAAAAVIVVVAVAALTVLSAIAGQKSGLEKSTGWHCAKPHRSAPAHHDVAGESAATSFGHSLPGSRLVISCSR